MGSVTYDSSRDSNNGYFIPQKIAYPTSFSPAGEMVRLAQTSSIYLDVIDVVVHHIFLAAA